jgi:hypothetical protein
MVPGIGFAVWSESSKHGPLVSLVPEFLGIVNVMFKEFCPRIRLTVLSNTTNNGGTLGGLKSAASTVSFLTYN